MELIKFIMWLTAGAVIGWFASRVVKVKEVLLGEVTKESVRQCWYEMT